MRGENYEEFVEKFKLKKTTDDCYTPPQVYEVIADYVKNRYNISREAFIRPFYPGGDYQAEEYKEKIVVDNPPFSILGEIVKWYNKRDIPFFLFSPGLTAAKAGVTVISICTDIIYENGARVKTAFITNMEPGVAIRTDPELSDKIKSCFINKQKKAREIPDNIITSATIIKYTRAGYHISIPWDDCKLIREYDGKKLYGAGYECNRNILEYAEETQNARTVPEQHEAT